MENVIKETAPCDNNPFQNYILQVGGKTHGIIYLLLNFTFDSGKRKRNILV